MGRDEQVEEREVLDSIFPDEITGPCQVQLYTQPPDDRTLDLSETSYRISIALDVAKQDDDDSDPRK